MTMPEGEQPRGFRFSIRELLLLTLLIAAALGWRHSSERSARQLRDLQRRIMHAHTAILSDKMRENTLPKNKQPASRKGLDQKFSDLTLDGVNLQGVSINGDDQLFQRATLVNCNLSGTTLAGSFQCARFDGSNLAGAKLRGGGSSFQLSSFADVDLIGATLQGGGSSFQGSSFAGADLTDATIICSGTSFQAVKVDGANFQGADLSRLDHGSLESCYFQEPPTYDERTRFPVDFDPVEAGWKRKE
ncbi:MAG: hypothetical protein C0485_17050 [Pirellula sp.]|nr:hypothetical protein [Pirellula sp.]